VTVGALRQPMCSLLWPSHSCKRFCNMLTERMCINLSHLPRLPRGGISFVLLTQICETQLLSPIKAPGKPPRIIPAWTILPALDRQARPRRDITLGETLHRDNQHFRPRLTTEVTLESVQMYLVYLALALLRSKSRWAASQYNGVGSPLNSFRTLTPPGATCRGVTAFVCYYSLYLLLLY